jgi:hypothetical protein
MAVMVKSHGSHTVTRLSRLSWLYTQLLKSMSKLTSASIPLAPGETVILSSLITVNNPDLVRVQANRSFHEVR